MQRLKKAGDGFLLGALVFLLFLTIFENHLHVPEWLMVLGHMHPLFLHFPIVLLLISYVSIWLPVSYRNEELFAVIRLLAAITAVITAIMGLILSQETENGGTTLLWHKWGGIGIAVSGYLFYIFYRSFTATVVPGKIFTIASTVLMFMTGDFGGDLTHGKNYLLAPVENKEKKLVPLEDAVVFEDVIKPLFVTKCGTCHANGNHKGGLALDDSAALLKGGRTGPLFVAGEPDISLLLKRIHLPEEDKKHMPPISKTQLTNAEIALLTAWIRSGALMNYKVAQLPLKDSFRVLATAQLAPASVNSGPVYEFSAANEKTIRQLNNNYRVLEPLGLGSPALAVSFFGRDHYSQQSLEELLEVKKQVVSLSLSRMPVKDADLGIITKFENLEKLNLNSSDITAKGLAQLTGMPKLKELSLSGTAVTAGAAAQLAQLPNLHSLFIWNTPIDTLQVAALKKKFPRLYIENGFVANDSFLAELSPPIIESKNTVFDSSYMIKIRHPLKGAEIRYTLDGTPPDSANSPVYNDSFAITKDAKLVARAFKKRWIGSGPVNALMLKRGLIPDSIHLVTPVDPKYTSPPGILSDTELGDLIPSSGKWLGYMNNPSVIDFYFRKPVTIHSVLINFMKRVEAYIFMPVKLEVYGGMSASDMRLLQTLRPPMPAKTEPGILVQQVLPLSSSRLKFLRIVAQPIQALPAWHPGKGKKGWVFLSEVIFN